MREAEYRRLKKAIDDEHRTKLAALDLIYGMSRPPKQKPESPTHRGPLNEAVKSAIAAMPGDFKPAQLQAEIEAKLGHGILRASLSSALNRMVHAGDIEVVHKGAGRAPSLYRRKIAAPLWMAAAK